MVGDTREDGMPYKSRRRPKVCHVWSCGVPRSVVVPVLAAAYRFVHDMVSHKHPQLVLHLVSRRRFKMQVSRKSSDGGGLTHYEECAATTLRSCSSRFEFSLCQVGTGKDCTSRHVPPQAIDEEYRERLVAAGEHFDSRRIGEHTSSTPRHSDETAFRRSVAHDNTKEVLSQAQVKKGVAAGVNQIAGGSVHYSPTSRLFWGELSPTLVSNPPQSLNAQR